MAMAALSFTEPDGLKNSSFAKTVAWDLLSLFMRTKGVLPMSSSMLFAIFIFFFLFYKFKFYRFWLFKIHKAAAECPRAAFSENLHRTPPRKNGQKTTAAAKASALSAAVGIVLNAS